METRRERMLGPGGPRGRGLEIGALHAPVVNKADHDVLYVDYATTEVVRANRSDTLVDVADIQDVDIVWGETPLRDAVGQTVDYVVASHVIEHVPDLIGWLRELHQVLRPGGVLGLAVPDKRFTFDAWRKDSTLAEAVEAHLTGRRRPSLRQVFDACALSVPVDIGLAWRDGLDPGAARAEVMGRIPGAYALAQNLLRSPRYTDCHCWVFTPASFLDLMEEFALLDAFPFAIEAFHPTEPDQIEFQLRLSALPDGRSQAGLASIRQARESLGEAAGPQGGDVTALAERDRLDALREENRRLRQAHADLQASNFWRATAPLRALARMVRGNRH